MFARTSLFVLVLVLVLIVLPAVVTIEAASGPLGDRRWSEDWRTGPIERTRNIKKIEISAGDLEVTVQM